MAALRPSPVALRASSATASAGAAAPISASLRRLPSSSVHRRFPALKLAVVTRRRGGRGASGASMMDTAAASYANALADVAQSNGTLEATVGDVDKIDKVFSDPGVQSFFANPTVSQERKLDVVKEIATSSELQPHTANFLSIIVEMNRADYVREIVKEFEACYNRITGTEVAVVSSVVELQSQDLAQIAKTVQKLTGAKNVRIKTVIDPSLIAGFLIRYGASGSKLIDMSVKKQLDEIAKQLDFSSITLA